MSQAIQVHSNRVQGSTRRAVYDYIFRFFGEHGYAPTVREVAKGLGICSPATVHRHMTGLAREGLITRAGNKARAVCLVEI
ncbi:MAG: helix-turn-helix domain-containing protein [Christensenellaceae bacterium]|nr:helix-turn-helix domain-containing protein [Christensenellaceae bacterium]